MNKLTRRSRNKSKDKLQKMNINTQNHKSMAKANATLKGKFITTQAYTKKNLNKKF